MPRKAPAEIRDRILLIPVVVGKPEKVRQRMVSEEEARAPVAAFPNDRHCIFAPESETRLRAPRDEASSRERFHRKPASEFLLLPPIASAASLIAPSDGHMPRAEQPKILS